LTTLRVGTRGSALALAQAESVVERLPGGAEIVKVTTAGDLNRAAGDKSRWVGALERALADGEIDLAVHSAKDVPGELAEGCALVAAPPRADARDVLIGAPSLAALPEGARVGTSSVRRRSQLLAARADLKVAELRGNVDTRLRKLAAGEADALVLAWAGLERLGVLDGNGAAPLAIPLPNPGPRDAAPSESDTTPAITPPDPARSAPSDPLMTTRLEPGRTDATRLAPVTPLDGDLFVPAPGQGTLAVEARADDRAAAAAVAALNDPSTFACLRAERAVVRALDATCHTPVGAHATLDGSRLALAAFVGLPDGSAWIRDDLDGDAADPEALGGAVAERLLAAGAGELLALVR
jgi:hydroxymethylbilane synthase